MDDVAMFDSVGGIVAVPSLTTIEQLYVLNTAVTLDLGAAGNQMDITRVAPNICVLVGAFANEVANLTLRNGTYGLAASTNTVIGLQTGSDGTVTVAANAHWVPENVLLAIEPNSEGNLRVQGGMASVFGDILIGFNGTGTMEISNGGTVVRESFGDDVIGANSAASGVVTVSGTGSKWVPELLVIGKQGDGTLIIEDGGVVQDLGAYVGFDAAAQGAVSVNGPGSIWSSKYLLSLGDEGSVSGVGTVTMSGSGSRIYVGDQAEAAGANLPATETAIVVSGQEPSGDPEAAELRVFNASSMVGATNLYAGVNTSDYAKLTVDGSSSTIDVDHSLYLAGTSSGPSGATAELIVRNNGVVNAGAKLQVHSGGEVTLLTNGAVNVGTGTGSAGRINVLPLGTLSGAGVIHGAVQNIAGAVAPGASTGILAIDGNYQQESNGTLEIEIGGTAAGTQHDRLAVTGSATLNGTLNIGLINSFVPSAGQSFDFLTTTGSVSGTFATEALPPIAGGLFFDVIYASNKVTLIVDGILGNYNFDGVVDAADYVAWRKIDGSEAGYNTWRENFGRTLNNSSSAFDTPDAQANVPEPASGPLAALAAMIFASVQVRRAQ